MQPRLNKFIRGIKSSQSQVDISIDPVRPMPGHYQARYLAYLRENIIEPKLNGIFFDEYDEMPGSVYVTAHRDGRVLGGVRIKVLERLDDPSISTCVYGNALAENLEMTATAIDVSRMFTIKGDGATVTYLQFCLMRAIFKCAETYGARYILAPVKAGHVAFYCNFLCFDLVAEPIAYPGLSRPIGLTCCDLQASAGVAAQMGVRLTPGLSALLGFANGIRLDWRIDNVEDYGGYIAIGDLRSIQDPETHELTEEDGFELPGGPEIPEIQGVAVDRWLPLEFFKRHEDNFEAAGLLPHGERLDVFVSDDDIACFDSRLIDLGHYIDLLVRAYGSPLARMALLPCLTYRKPDVDAGKAYPALLTQRYNLDNVIQLTTNGPLSIEATTELFALES